MDQSVAAKRVMAWATTIIPNHFTRRDSGSGSCHANTRASAAPVSGTVTLNGSSALDPLVAAAKDLFEAANPNATVQHTPTNSGTGLSQVAAGAVNIGMSDYPASAATGLANASQLVDHQVAVSAFLLIAKILP